MMTKKPSKSKPKPVIKYSGQRLAIGYAELLRLRQAVRQAELLAKTSRSGARSAANAATD
jgi:hypothetical protein